MSWSRAYVWRTNTYFCSPFPSFLHLIVIPFSLISILFHLRCGKISLLFFYCSCSEEWTEFCGSPDQTSQVPVLEGDSKGSAYKQREERKVKTDEHAHLDLYLSDDGIIFRRETNLCFLLISGTFSYRGTLADPVFRTSHPISDIGKAFIGTRARIYFWEASLGSS